MTSQSNKLLKKFECGEFANDFPTVGLTKVEAQPRLVAIICLPGSGYLFSGSRPGSLYKDSPPSGALPHPPFPTALCPPAKPDTKFHHCLSLLFLPLQTTSHSSPAAGRPPRCLRPPPRWPVPSRPAPALADCGGPSSAPLASTSAARSCGCSPPTVSPPWCPVPCPRRTTMQSLPPPSTVAAFHATYHPSKARMVREKGSICIPVLSFMTVPLDGTRWTVFFVFFPNKSLTRFFKRASWINLWMVLSFF